MANLVAEDETEDCFSEFHWAVEDYETQALWTVNLASIFNNPAAEKHELEYANARRESIEFHLRRSAEGLVARANVLRVLGERLNYPTPCLQRLSATLAPTSPQELPPFVGIDDLLAEAADEARRVEGAAGLPGSGKLMSEQTKSDSDAHVLTPTIAPAESPTTLTTKKTPRTKQWDWLETMDEMKAVSPLTKRTIQAIHKEMPRTLVGPDWSSYKKIFGRMKKGQYVESDGDGYWLSKWGAELLAERNRQLGKVENPPPPKRP